MRGCSVHGCTNRFVCRLRGTWLRPRLDLYTAFAVCRCAVGHLRRRSRAGHGLSHDPGITDLECVGARAPRSGFQVRARSPHPLATRACALLRLRCCSLRSLLPPPPRPLLALLDAKGSSSLPGPRRRHGATACGGGSALARACCRRTRSAASGASVARLARRPRATAALKCQAFEGLNELSSSTTRVQTG